MTIEAKPTLIKITAVPANASKAQEIDAFEKMADVGAPGTYLASFFTLELRGWCGSKVLNDLGTDLLGAYMDAERAASDARGGLAEHNAAAQNLMRRWDEERVAVGKQHALEIEAVRHEAATREREQTGIITAHRSEIGELQDRLARYTRDLAALVGAVDATLKLATNAWVAGTALTPEQVRDALAPSLVVRQPFEGDHDE